MLCKALNCRVGLVGLVVVLFSPVVAAAGDAVDLKPKFPPGRNQYVEINMEARQVVKGPMAPGGEMEIKIKQVTGIMEKVASSSKEGAKIALLYDRRGMAFENPMMGNLHYDSDMPGEEDSPYIKQMLAPIVGMSLKMEIDGSGQVTSFSGMDAILKKVEASAGGNPFFSQMKSSFTDDAAKSTWGDSRWIILPDHAVKPGDTWKCRDENDAPQIGTLVSDFDCKLERVTESDGRKLAVIAFTGTISQLAKKDDSGEAASGGLKVKEGTIKGTATFDVAAGQIINQSRETHLALTMPSPGGEESPGTEVTATTKETLVVRSPAERERAKKENIAKARAKEAEAKKAESKKSKADSE